jgi:hypothetical protein
MMWMARAAIPNPNPDLIQDPFHLALVRFLRRSRHFLRLNPNRPTHSTADSAAWLNA